MSKVLKLPNASGYNLLKIIRSVNDNQLIGSIDTAINARRGGHLLNVLEDELSAGLGEYASKLDQVIKNADEAMTKEIEDLPVEERLFTNPAVQVIQAKRNEDAKNAALLLGLEKLDDVVAEITIASDDRAKYLNAALDKLAGQFPNRKEYVKVCDAVDEALK